MSEPDDPAPLLDRREAIRRVSAALGAAAFIGGSGLVAALERTGELPEVPPGEFTVEQVAFLDEIAETILPATNTPGAKAANTGAFMALMVTDAYSPEMRRVFLDGMRQLDAAMRQAHGVTFLAASAAQRLALLNVIDREQKRQMDAVAAAALGKPPAIAGPPAHYFRMMKELALLGFFTSQVGCTQVLRYVETPGRYDPCVPYAPGEPALAAHA
jgi:hypothetical protein